MTFSIITFSIMSFNLMAFSIMAFSILTFIKMLYSIITLSLKYLYAILGLNTAQYETLIIEFRYAGFNCAEFGV